MSDGLSPAELLESHLEGGRSRKEFLTLLAALGLAAPLAARGALAATGRPAVKPNPLAKRRHFMNSFYTLNNDYFNFYDQGARAAAKVLNIRETREVNNFNLDVQKGHLENAPNIGIEGITMIANSEASAPDLLRLVNRLRIPTVNNHANASWNTPLDIGPFYVAYHVDNNVVAFQKLASALFRRLGGKGNILYIQGILGNSIESERTRGVELALKQFPGIKVLARRPGDWSRTTTRPVISDLLTAHPDVDAVICSNDDEAIAVVSALEERKSKALVTGCDAIKDMLSLIAQGRAYSTFAFHPSWLGGYSTAVVFDYLNGWRPSVPERMMYFGGFVLDSPAAAREYQRLVYGAKQPYNWLRMSKVLHPNDWNPGNLMVPIHPARHWAFRNNKPGSYRLPKEYAQAEKNGEFERVTKLYAKRFSSDPLASVRKLTRTGGQILI